MGAASPGVIQTQEALATVLRARRRHAESLVLYAAALETCRTLFKKPTPATADVLVGMGLALTEVGRAAEAKPLLEEAAEIRARAFPAADTRTADARAALARCTAAIGAVSAR
jgi:hypothetical protein